MPCARAARRRGAVRSLAAAMLALTTVCAPANSQATDRVATRAPASPSGARPSPTLTYESFNTTRLVLATTDIPGLDTRTLTAGDLALDQVAHLLYLTDRGGNAIHIFDIATPTARYAAAIPLPGPPGNLVIASDLRKLFVALAAGRIAVIDIDAASPRVRTVTSTISLVLPGLTVPGEVSAIEYAAPEHKVFFATSGGAVGSMDAVRERKNEMWTEIPDRRVGGLRYHPGDGYLYLTTERTMYRFDPRSGSAIASFTTFAGCAGIGIDGPRNQALVSCGATPDTAHIARWDFQSAKVVAIYDQIADADVIIFDATADRFFISAPRYARGPAIGMYGGPRGLFVTDVPTTPVSRAVAYDEANRVVYTQGPRGLLSFPSPPDRTP